MILNCEHLGWADGVGTSQRLSLTKVLNPLNADFLIIGSNYVIIMAEMIKFKILKQSTKSKARLGLLKTPHGVIETPALVTVATAASIKTLESQEAAKCGSQLLICNTFHLHLKPGEKFVKKAGGLHKFMNWNRPIMTDSGGFQVFSLGFGQDLGVGKILKYFPGADKRVLVDIGSQPTQAKILENGVEFRSPLNGDKLFLGPVESIKIQEAIGADIIFAFDECTPPLSSKEYVASAVERTHRWAKECLKTKKSSQAIYGIVQGSRFQDLRKKAAKQIAKLGFDGYGIGGDLGKNMAEMTKIIGWILPHLEPAKPRHLLGIGHPHDMLPIIKSGVDTFDCIAPTHYARRGVAFIACGKIDLRKSKYLTDQKPLDSKCTCYVCQNYKRSYISHLIRAKEITGMHLITQHNLSYFNKLVADIREKIKKNQI